MESSEIFEDTEEKIIKVKEDQIAKEKSKKFYGKGYKMGALILGLAIIVGVFILPMTVNDGVGSPFDNFMKNIPTEFAPTLNPTNTVVTETVDKEDSKPADFGTTSFGQATDDVVLSVSNLPIFGYEVIAEGMWSGDFVDTKKIPQSITNSNQQQFQFRCYIDPVVNTATYFGTFKSLEGNSIKVKVWRGDQVVQEKNGAPNQAVILEGVC